MIRLDLRKKIIIINYTLPWAFLVLTTIDIVHLLRYDNRKGKCKIGKGGAYGRSGDDGGGHAARGFHGQDEDLWRADARPWAGAGEDDGVYHLRQ